MGGPTIDAGGGVDVQAGDQVAAADHDGEALARAAHAPRRRVEPLGAGESAHAVVDVGGPGLRRGGGGGRQRHGDDVRRLDADAQPAAGVADAPGHDLEREQLVDGGTVGAR